MVIWNFVILTVFSCIRAKPTGTHNKYVLSTEYVQVEKISGAVFRHKRAAAIIFPNNMIFRFQIEAGEVTLNLERTSNHQAAKAPIYTIEESGIVFRNHTTKENFALYQDLYLGGSVLVKYPDGQLNNYELMGAFNYEGKNYQITPLDLSARQKRDAATHQVQLQDVPYGDFFGDELLPPPSTAGFNMPDYEQPPFPDENLREDTEPALMALREDFPEGKGINILPTTTEYLDDVDYLLPPGMDEFPNQKKRRRRDSETVYVEYMVVSDYKNTDNWKARVGGETDQEKLENAFDAMYEYYQFVINGIDVRFRTATSDGPNIRVVFSSLMVSTSANTSPWITKNKLSDDTVDDAGCLLDFALWKKATYSILPNHDHAALFTGFDLATPTSRSTLGMAYLNSVCAKAWSVSENEETYNAIVIHIASHELGHNIGSRHDGSGNSCKSSSLYLMAARLPQIYNAALASNPWTFSTCSQSAIASFVSQLGEANCLTNEPTSSRVNDIAGLVYSADEQCNMTYGNDAVLCRDNLYYRWDSVCYAMQCKQKGQSSCIGRIFPFEGTPCGNKKWCQSGMCVHSEDAPSTHETCVFGDDPHSACNSETSCNDNNFFSREVTCCGTCLSPTTTTSYPYSTTASTNPTSMDTTTSSPENTSLNSSMPVTFSSTYSFSSNSVPTYSTPSVPSTTSDHPTISRDSTTSYHTSINMSTTPNITPSSNAETTNMSSSQMTSLTTFATNLTSRKTPINVTSQPTTVTKDNSATTEQQTKTTSPFSTTQISSSITQMTSMPSTTNEQAASEKSTVTFETSSFSSTTRPNSSSAVSKITTTGISSFSTNNFSTNSTDPPAPKTTSPITLSSPITTLSYSLTSPISTKTTSVNSKSFPVSTTTTLTDPALSPVSMKTTSIDTINSSVSSKLTSISTISTPASTKNTLTTTVSNLTTNIVSKTSPISSTATSTFKITSSATTSTLGMTSSTSTKFNSPDPTQALSTEVTKGTTNNTTTNKSQSTPNLPYTSTATDLFTAAKTTTDGHSEDLSYELQTMISLFVTTALII